MGGYSHKVIFVDLTSGSVVEESLPQVIIRH